MMVPQPVRRNLAWLAGGEVAIKGGLLLAGVVVARGGGPAAMGVFTVAFGAALVAAQLLAAGQPEVVIREVARRRGRGVRPLLAAAQRVQRRMVPWGVPLLLGGAAVVGWRSAELRWALLAFLPYAVVRARLVVATAAFKGRDRMDVEVMARGVELAVALALLGVATLVGMPPWAPGLAFSAGVMAGGTRVRLLLRRENEEEVGLDETVLWREGLPFLGLAVATQLLVRADSFIQAGFGVPAELVGQYGVAQAAVWSLVAVSQLLALAGYPSVSRATAEGRLGPRHAVALALVGFVLGGAFAMALWFVKKPLIELVFGAAYGEATQLVGVLLWLLPGACAATLEGVVLAATGRQAWSLMSQAGLVVLVVAGNFLAVPRWGVWGSAAVAAASHTVSGCVVAALGMAAAARPRASAWERGR